MTAPELPPRHPVMDLTDELLRLGGRLRSLFSGVARQSGLSPMQLAVLTAVVEARRPPTVPQIGRSLGHPRQVIQRAANALLAAGLVDAVPNPDHKRAPLYRPTPAGIARKRAADAAALARARELLDLLPAGDCEQLVARLRDLRGRLEIHLKGRMAPDGT